MKNVLRVFVLALISIDFVSSKQQYDDAKCDEQLNSFDAAFEKREMWALKLFDTWAKVPSGILHGNHQNPGHYTECVKFRHEQVQGQHCMLTTTFADDVNLPESHFDWSVVGPMAQDVELGQGICLPATCSPQKVVAYANKIFEEDNLKASAANCRTNDPIEVGAIDVFAFTVAALLIAAVIFSTTYEVSMTKQSEEPNKLLAAFSFYSHGAKLFDTTESKSPNVINCLNGLKTISIFWIILGHRSDDRILLPVYNDISLIEQNLIYNLFTGYAIPVETFFVIGGLLVTWSMMGALDRNTLNVPRMYLHRYLRYTPTLAVMILFYVSFTKFLGSGPFFNPPTGECVQYWWTALLHISIYTNPEATCYEVPWYLAVDFQLFLFSPILIYPLWRWGKKFFWVLPCIVVLTQGCLFAIAWKYEFHVYNLIQPNMEEFVRWHRMFYFPPHLRLGPWSIGIMVGYIMYYTKGKKVKINKYLDAFLWILSISMLTYLVVIWYPFQQRIDNKTTRFQNALHLTIHRTLWSYSLAWIIFACQNGTGGIVRWFLSHRQWQPLGRMGLSIYLTHRIYQLITTYSSKQPIDYDFWGETQKFYGDLLASIFLATILYLAVENPVFVIEGYIYKNITSKKSRSQRKLVKLLMLDDVENYICL